MSTTRSAVLWDLTKSIGTLGAQFTLLVLTALWLVLVVLWTYVAYPLLKVLVMVLLAYLLIHALRGVFAFLTGTGR